PVDLPAHRRVGPGAAGLERDAEVDARRSRQIDAVRRLEEGADVLAGEELLLGRAAVDQVVGLHRAGALRLHRRTADVRVAGEDLAGDRVTPELRDAEEGRAGLIDVAQE